MALKGVAYLLGAVENQHSETCLNTSQIKFESIKAELWFLKHPFIRCQKYYIKRVFDQ